jgi:hypothetical protein
MTVEALREFIGQHSASAAGLAALGAALDARASGVPLAHPQLITVAQALYDLLERIYDGRLARARKQKKQAGRAPSAQRVTATWLACADAGKRSRSGRRERRHAAAAGVAPVTSTPCTPPSAATPTTTLTPRGA